MMQFDIILVAMGSIEGNRMYLPEPEPPEAAAVVSSVSELYEQARILDILDGLALIYSTEPVWQIVFLVRTLDVNFSGPDPLKDRSTFGRLLFDMQLEAEAKIKRQFPQALIGAQFLERDENGQYPLERYIQEQLTPPKGLRNRKITTVFCRFAQQVNAN